MFALVLVNEKGDAARIEVVLQHFFHHPASAPNDDFIHARQRWVFGKQGRFDGGSRANPREHAQRVRITRIETSSRLRRDRFQTVTREQARQR